jgi:hypothetical protein
VAVEALAAVVIDRRSAGISMSCGDLHRLADALNQTLLALDLLRSVSNLEPAYGNQVQDQISEAKTALAKVRYPMGW